MGQHILFFGATGILGQELCAPLLSQGHHITACVRDLNKAQALSDIGVDLVHGDVMDGASMQDVFANIDSPVDVVLSSIGGMPFTDPTTWPDWIGHQHMIDCAKQFGVGRFILVTTLGCGNSLAYQHDGFRKVLGELAALKTKAEDYLVASGIPYTIVRPGGLGTGGPENRQEITEATGRGIFLETEKVRGSIARADLAERILDLFGPNADMALGKILSVVDSDILVTPEKAVEPFTL